MLVAPEDARRRVKQAIRSNLGTQEEGGMLGGAAKDLGVSRLTLYRVISSDDELTKFVSQYKEKDFNTRGWTRGSRRRRRS